MEINNPLRDGMSGFMMALEAQKSAVDNVAKPLEGDAHKQLATPKAVDDENKELPQAVTSVETTLDLLV
ncbi:MAG: hypothetical protein D6E12_17090 [Desulfovibrio sp.]|nr:MAG: hypothetical protein D6E12_17090 [Desulfovibrio sp.]